MASGGVTFTGWDETIKKLEEKFSPAKVSRIENKALSVGARVIKANLKHGVASYMDTGATFNEVVAGKPRLRSGHRSVKIGWAGDGSKQRWRLVHLNEFGYTRFGRTYSPRGMGKVQSAYNSSKEAAKAAQVAELKRLVK